MFFTETFISNLPGQPTNDQKNAIAMLEKFTMVHHPCAILSGHAGSGKTCLLAAFIKTLQKLEKRFFLLAPTGRAAKVLSGFSGCMAETIHHHIYIITDYPDGSFEVDLRYPAPSNSIFIVDEASMISCQPQSGWTYQSLLSDLITYILSGRDNQILFVGDPCQLPPVKENFSTALNAAALTSWFGTPPITCVLSEIVRQSADSGLLNIAIQAREGVEGDSHPIHLPNSPDVQILAGRSIIPGLKQAYREYGVQHVAVITHSNHDACFYNQLIRENIFHRSCAILEAGDRIMIIKNNYFWKTLSIPFLANGEIIRIESVDKIERVATIPFCDATLEIEKGGEKEFVFAKLNLALFNSENLLLDSRRQRQLFRVRCHTPGFEKNRDPYLRALLVKPAYAMTAHKSQGGQWKAVFVDRGGIKILNSDLTERRWFYTAVTRPTEKLFFVETPKRLALGEFDYAIPVPLHKNI
jgi:exodeoxyribonuclease V